MRKKSVTRLIQVGLHQPQEDIVRKIEAEGREVTGIIRTLIDKYGQEHYPTEPGYVEVAKERLAQKKRTAEEQEAWEKISPEDYTINTLKGRVGKGCAWFMMATGTPGGITLLDIPLAEIKKYTYENRELIQIHTDILNHKFIKQRPGNSPIEWTNEDCESAIASYNNEMDRMQVE